MKILYECTYGLRGRSGIPRDTRNLVTLFKKSNEVQLVVNLSNQDVEIGSKNLSNKLYKFKLIVKSIIEGQFGKNKITLEKLGENEVQILNTEFGIPSVKDAWKMKLNNLSRFLRIIFRAPVSLTLDNFDYFIQQQIDPIRVSGSVKHIVRLHDILPITHSEFFKKRAKIFFKMALRKMVRNNAISWVMDTEASATEFKSIYGPNLDVVAIPSLIESKFFDSNISKTREKIVLMVNTIEPRKGIERAILAFTRLKSQNLLGADWRFIIAGNEGWKSKKLMKNLRGGFFGNSVTYKEGLSDAEIIKLMSQSAVLISASSAEGFGLPPLEGTAMGCVAAVSDIPQHHETLGKFAFYFNPADQEEIEKVLKDACEYSITLPEEKASEMRSYILRRFGEVNIQRMWDAYLGSKDQ